MKSGYIYGRNPVIEALKSGGEVEKIYLAQGVQGGAISSIYSSAKRYGVQIVTYDKRKFASLEKDACPKDKKSQGVIAVLKQYKEFALEELIESAFLKTSLPVVVALDGINDPQNLGAIARSAEAAGAAGIIITERNSAPVTPAAVKASAGALSYLPVVKISSLITALEKLKEAGFWIFGTDSEGKNLYTDGIYDSPVLLIIGSEGKGLRPSTKKHCDFIVNIPLYGKVSSLNASVSAGIVLFEINRQRSLKQD